MAMTLIKKTAEYKIFKRGDGRFAVQNAQGKAVNGEEKVRALVAEDLIKETMPSTKAVAEEAPEAAVEEVAEAVSDEAPEVAVEETAEQAPEGAVDDALEAPAEQASEAEEPAEQAPEADDDSIKEAAE